MYTIEHVAGMIDHTNLKADATDEDFVRLCDEAKAYGFKSVAINPYPVAFCRAQLKGSDVLTGAAISFPLGQTTIATKVAEATRAIDDGCQEFDYVINVGRAKMHDWAFVEDEMGQMVAVARTAGICVKAIFETCCLDSDEIAHIARIAARARPDFIKTSTGFGTAGATVENVRIMREHCGPEVAVKAAGGIRSWDAARTLIDAGATRLGTSSGIAIIQEMRDAGLA